MTTFEFVSVLLSLVISLALAHLLTGVARLVRAKTVKLSFLLLGWMGVALFECIDFWFSLWHARETGTWSLGYVMLWLLGATSVYLFAWLIVPEGDLEGRDLGEHFHDTRRQFLLAHAGYLLLGFLINITVAAFQDLVSPMFLLWFVPIVAAWVWSNRWVQLGALTMTWLLIAYYAANFLSAL
ncbi:MAG: hypothetical protein AB7H66_14405 [Hyphomonadaceae bacterium]